MFQPPVKPGQHLVVPNNTKDTQMSNICRTHQEQYDDFFEYNQTNKTIKPQITSVVNYVRIRSLRSKHIVYANAATLVILTHLHSTHATITECDLNKNNECLKASFSPDLPFEILIDPVEDDIEHAAAGKEPHKPKNRKFCT